MKRSSFQCLSAAFFLIAIATVKSGGGEKDKAFPKGSEKAIAAVRDAIANAQIDEAVEPKGFFGSGGKGTPLFWTVRYRVNDKKQEVSVTPEGTIIRLPAAVEVKNLPGPVADAVAKAAPGAMIKSAEKNEIRATLKYVAMERPQVRQYVVDVVKDDKHSRVVMSGTGTNVKVTELKDKKDDKLPGKNPDGLKEIEIPKKAVKAVAAIKGLYPDAIVEQITLEVFDDGSGVIETLTYEIEFFTRGTKREMVASPDGIIPHLTTVVDVKSLPKAVLDALDKTVPVKVEKAHAQEVRASLRFGPLAEVRHYYAVMVDKDGKTEAIKVRPDGELVKKAGFPKKK